MQQGGAAIIIVSDSYFLKTVSSVNLQQIDIIVQDKYTVGCRIVERVQLLYSVFRVSTTVLI